MVDSHLALLWLRDFRLWLPTLTSDSDFRL